VKEPSAYDTQPIPTAAASSSKIRVRTEEDDRLVAALIFLPGGPENGPSAPPSPFATVGGISLLRRAAASCKVANVPKLFLAGGRDEGALSQVKNELRQGGWDGPVDVWSGGAPPWGERGRLLILDAAGVHDPEAVGRLARWKGERACVLVSTEGDGIRVQVEGARVREVGTQLVPFDGVTCGAVNVPIPLFPRLSENGALSALIALAADGLLGAAVEHRTFAREIASEMGLSEARQRLLERASGGPHDTLLNRFVARPVARPITQQLLPLGVSPRAASAGSVVVGLVGAGLLTGGGAPPTAVFLLAGVALILASTILDTVAFELRSFAIQPDSRRSRLDVAPHGLVAAGALAALGYGAQRLGVESGFLLGLVGAGGVGAATLLLVAARGGDTDSEDQATVSIEFLARRLLNREIGWVLLLLVLAHVGTRLLAHGAPPSNVVLERGLLVLAGLAQAFWVALGVFLALKPSKV
jgi:hypothetical protein